MLLGRSSVRWVAALLALLALSGCYTSLVVPTREQIEIPAIGDAKEVELGDTVIKRGQIYTYDALELLNEVRAGDGVFFTKVKVFPQTLVAELEDNQWTYYYGDNVTAHDAILGTKRVRGGLKIKKSDPKVIQLFMTGTEPMGMLPKPKPLFEITRTYARDKPSFIQELIYNGRSDDTVKFLYREYADEYIRAPFTQDVQYDLSESDTVGFKGARIQILEASNTMLRYVVLLNFPDPESIIKQLSRN